MFEFIVFILFIFSICKWLAYSKAFKGLMYYIGTNFGEEEIAKIDIGEVIQTAIENTLNEFRN